MVPVLSVERRPVKPCVVTRLVKKLVDTKTPLVYLLSSADLNSLKDELEPATKLVRRRLRQSGMILMNSDNNKQTAEAIGSALWSAHLEQVCLTGIKPFFVMDQTARTGP